MSYWKNSVTQNSINKGFIKNEEEIKNENLHYQSYKEGFYDGCRDVITVGNDDKELGVGD